MLLNSSNGLAERITSCLSRRSFTPFDNLVIGVIAVLHRGKGLVKGLGRYAAIAPDCQSVAEYCYRLIQAFRMILTSSVLLSSASRNR